MTARTPEPPRPRDTIASIPAYVAGKPPTPRPGQKVFKLSSNENPYPPLPGVVEAAEAAVAAMNRYPDMGSAALYAALADAMGVPAEDLAAATGSVALIYQLVNAFCEPGDEVVYAWRSFEAYPIAVTAGGARSVQVPYFSTVVRGGTTVVAKRLGSVTLNFLDGDARAQSPGTASAYVNRAAATLPADIRERITRRRRAGDEEAAIDPLSQPEVRTAIAQATFELLIGFQLTDPQLRYNATR